MRLKKLQTGLLAFMNVAEVFLPAKPISMLRAFLSVKGLLYDQNSEDDEDKQAYSLADSEFAFILADGTCPGTLTFNKIDSDTTYVHANFDGSILKDHFAEIFDQYKECMRVLKSEGILHIQATIPHNAPDNLRKLLSQGGFHISSSWDLYSLDILEDSWD